MNTIPCPRRQQNAPAKRQILRLSVAARSFAGSRFAPDQPATTRPLRPEEALALIDRRLRQGPLAEVELAGPGDPLTAIDTCLATLRVIADRHPALPLSLTTLGIGLDRCADLLRQAGLSRVRLQVEAVDPRRLEKIYLWIRPGNKTLPLAEAAGLLIDAQRRAIPACKKAGLTVHVVSTTYPGQGDDDEDHFAAIDREMTACGADRVTRIPFPAETEGASADSDTAAAVLSGPSQQRPNLAVASSGGFDIDLHLGQARQLLIYGPRPDGLICLLETRPTPEPGSTDRRWQALAAGLADCFAILAANAGETPQKELSRAGVNVLLGYDTIEGTVDALYGGGKKGNRGRLAGR